LEFVCATISVAERVLKGDFGIEELQGISPGDKLAAYLAMSPGVATHTSF
jgi:hypothetical protein